MNQIFPEKIKLTTIKMVNGSIECAPELAMKNPVIHSFTTEFEADFRINYDLKNITYFIKVKLQAIDKELKPIAIKAEYSFSLAFTVDNLSDYIVERTNSGIVVELILAGTLMGIAYSTIRGMVLSRTEGTILDGIILPVVDPKSLIAHKARK
ncbi:MAG: hypothetical protein RLZZ367_2388 [Bacteroidota bacterium]|jgi:hypothetical protein